MKMNQMNQMNQAVKVDKEKEIAFRIVKERWFHRFLDKVTNKLFGVLPSTPPTYQIHLSVYLIKRFGKWIAYDHNQIKSYKFIPHDFHQREWAKKENQHKEENKFRETGFEIDMSDIGLLTEEERLKRKEKDKKTKDRIGKLGIIFQRNQENHSDEEIVNGLKNLEKELELEENSLVDTHKEYKQRKGAKEENECGGS